jgi:hypothetical protein
MKVLNIIDLVVQTIMIGLVLVIGFIFAINRQADTISTAAFGGAMVLGPWQFGSSIVSNILKRPLFSLRRIHLMFSIIYLVVFSFIVGFAGLTGFVEKVGAFASTVFYCVPAGLALFYYNITFNTFRLLRSGSPSE